MQALVSEWGGVALIVVGSALALGGAYLDHRTNYRRSTK